MTYFIPAELSSFIGRADQLRGVAEQLSRARLVTLCGFGGCGKTRLALRMARDAAADRVWFVELAAVSDDDLVASTVGASLGTRGSPGLSTTEAIARQIGLEPALLVLDNCEQVIAGAAALVGQLLTECPQLTVLATSREPLSVTGEVAWTVPPLADDEARQLFIERADAANPTQRLSDGDDDTVSAICRQLDGIPLAIELAAARVRSLGVHDVLAGLTDRFALLTSGARTASPRQRTLRASLLWSHDLLAPQQQVALRRLSVFAGDFDLDAARHVVPCDDFQPGAVADLIGQLVDRSLVVATATSGSTRYRMLDTVRQFGLERLADAGEQTAVRDRHLAHFHDRLRREVRDDRRWDGATMASIDAVHDNVTAALSWALHSGNGTTGLAMATLLWTYWLVRGRYDDGRTWLKALEAAAPGDLGPLQRAGARYAMCWLAEFQGDFPASLQAATSALALARQAGDRGLEGLCLTKVGYSLAMVDYTEGMTALRSGLAIAEDRQSETEAVTASFFIGWFTVMREGCPAAEPFLIRAAGGVGPATLYSPHAVAVLGYLRFMQGELAEAQELIERATATFETMGEHYWLAVCSSMRSQLSLLRGQRDEAVRQAHQAVAYNDHMRQSATTSLTRLCLAIALLDMGDQAGAGNAADDGLSCPGVGWLDNSTRVLLHAARALATDRLGRDREVSGSVAAAQSLLDQPHGPSYGAQAQLALGELARVSGDLPSAERHARAALHRLASAGAVVLIPDALDLLARCEPGRVVASRLRGAASEQRRRIGTASMRWCVHSDDREVIDADAAAQGAQLSLDETIAWVNRGRGSRKRPAVGWDSLTPAEHSVVRLVVEGLTNAEIATRLFVSRRTVTTHLGHVFAKLGVKTRAELASAAVRQGL